MNRGRWIGIASGICLFLVFLAFFLYQSSDFDQQLVSAMEQGEPAEKLIPQIEADSENLKLRARKHFESHIMDEKYWSEPSLASEKDYADFKNEYDARLDTVKQYEELRKLFVSGGINKQDFLERVKDFKAILET